MAAELRNDHLLNQENLRFVSKGQSMEPLLKDGDEILVRRVSAEGLWFGDLVTYELNGIFITHRFFYRKNLNQDLFLMVKADNRSKPDALVPSASLIGKVVEPKSRTFGKYVFTILSLTEWKLFEVILFIKRGAFKKLRINASTKQRLASYVRKSKQWLLRRILSIQKVSMPQFKHE